MQAGLVVGQLAFVDQQPGIDFPALHRGDDLVERDHLEPEIHQQQLQQQVRAGHRAWHPDPVVGHLADLHRFPGHDHRPTAVTKTSAAAQQGVLIHHVAVGVGADRRDVQFAFHGLVVEGFDVGNDMLEREAVGLQFAVGQGVKHERIIRVRAVANGNFAWFHQ